MKIHIVMQWGDTVHSVWTSRKVADAVAEDLASYSWKVTVETHVVQQRWEQKGISVRKGG